MFLAASAAAFCSVAARCARRDGGCSTAVSGTFRYLLRNRSMASPKYSGGMNPSSISGTVSRWLARAAVGRLPPPGDGDRSTWLERLIAEWRRQYGRRPRFSDRYEADARRLMTAVARQRKLIAGTCVFAIAVVAWLFVQNVFVGKEAARIEPPDKASQDVLTPLIGGTPSFYSCTSRAQCAPGNACGDNGGDKGYYCKPYCAEESDCTNIRKRYSSVKCLPLSNSLNLRICNDHESSLIPEP
jgi:hypothetical protein